MSCCSVLQSVCCSPCVAVGVTVSVLQTALGSQCVAGSVLQCVCCSQHSGRVQPNVDKVEKNLEIISKLLSTH